MILTADSGATKTDWGIGTGETDFRPIRTDGINPFHQTEEHIRNIISGQLLPQLPSGAGDISHIYFYGAGCTPDKSDTVARNLHRIFSSSIEIYVGSDMLGAARALYKHTKGIACILGTGSNSCLYDGEKIIDNIPPLGYVLGDEGSGAYLGKRFIGDCIKRRLPQELLEGLLEEYKLTVPEILNNVYRMPEANRYLAGFSPYIHKVKSNPEVHGFLIDCFNSFFQRNVCPYGNEWTVSFVGSIAWYFQEEIRESAKANGLITALFAKSPIRELTAFHFDNLNFKC